MIISYLSVMLANVKFARRLTGSNARQNQPAGEFFLRDPEFRPGRQHHDGPRLFDSLCQAVALMG